MKPCRHHHRNALHGLVTIMLAFCLTLLTPSAVTAQAADPLLEQARQALRDKDVRTAGIHLKNLLRESPSNVDARTLLGQIRFAQRDYPGAAFPLHPAFLVVLVVIGERHGVAFDVVDPE